MYTVIAIEGIDRIGKSTFINELKWKLDSFIQTSTSDKVPVVIEKPIIGAQNLKSIGYPLQDVTGIMEIRNIGLMEEFLYRCTIAKQLIQKKIIIRDRFNFSELAYGEMYRKRQMSNLMQRDERIDAYPGLALYRKWNNWFEEEMDNVARVIAVTFILDESSYPNDDEGFSASQLVPVNEKFKEVATSSKFKHNFIFELKKNPDTGMTDVMDYVDTIYHEVLKLTYNAI